MKHSYSRFRSFAVLIFGLFVALAFASCANIISNKSDSGSVSFTLGPDFFKAVSSSARSVTIDSSARAADGENGGWFDEEPHQSSRTYEITLALVGDYSDSKVLPYTREEWRKLAESEKVTSSKTITFDKIPAGSSVQAVCLVSMESRLEMFGVSDSVTISSGSNSVSLPLKSAYFYYSKDTINIYGTASGYTNQFMLSIGEPKDDGTGVWSISYYGYSAGSSSGYSYNETVSIGTYKVLATDEDGDPTSLSVTEYAYLTTGGEYKVVSNPKAVTIDFSDDSETFSFTSAGGITISFADDENEASISTYSLTVYA